VPDITLQPGELYFRLDGRPSLLLGTNPTGWMPEQFRILLGWAGRSERIVRIHLTNGRVPHATPGEVDEDWAVFWDEVFDTRAQNGLNVLPVFDVWAGWNDGDRAQSWRSNPYNAALGGPAPSPAELLRDTPTRRLWQQWLQTLVARWEGRSNIMGWEIFSELDLITGASEDAAVDFVESSAAVIRTADTRLRPVTASLAGTNDWPRLSRSSAVDFIQIHPYANVRPFNGNLDDLILVTVRQRLAEYSRPVFIGESGLDARAPVNTLTVAPRASVGIKYAIWASAVSGAMNGRMLWFEDGYDQYRAGLDLRSTYKDAAAPVARFLQDVDYSGFQPIDVAVDSEVKGAALGNDRVVVGWVRDVRSAAPDWPTRSINDQTVTVAAPGQSRDWLVTFYDTDSGGPMGSISAARDQTSIPVALPSFEGSIAFQMRPTNDSSACILPGARIATAGRPLLLTVRSKNECSVSAPSNKLSLGLS